MRAALIASAGALALAGAGCGGAGKTASTTTSATHGAPTVLRAATTRPTGLRVGVVGPLDISVPGATVRHVSLRAPSAQTLVVVSSGVADAAAVAAAAAANPGTHYALVGGTSKGYRRPNFAGLVIREDQAARLGGVVAGLVAAEIGGVERRVAWIGPEERALLAAFTRGVHDAAPGTIVLHHWSKRVPASCKEAALATIARNAVVVMAHGGLCAEAAVAGAHEQNLVGLRLTDFEFRSVPASLVVRDAVAGIFHGKEDLVFGAASGAIGIRRLDPRVPPATAVRARAAAQELASGLRPSG